MFTFRGEVDDTFIKSPTFTTIPLALTTALYFKKGESNDALSGKLCS